MISVREQVLQTVTAYAPHYKEAITDDTLINHLGFDSLDIVEVAIDVEYALGMPNDTIGGLDFDEAETVGEMVKYVEGLY